MKIVLYRVDTAGKETGLGLNLKKTKVMRLEGANSQEHQDNESNNTPLANVHDFKYLGTAKTQDGTCTKISKQELE